MTAKLASPEELAILDTIFDKALFNEIESWTGEEIAWELIRHYQPYRDLYDKYIMLEDSARNCEYNGTKKIYPMKC